MGKFGTETKESGTYETLTAETVGGVIEEEEEKARKREQGWLCKREDEDVRRQDDELERSEMLQHSGCIMYYWLFCVLAIYLYCTVHTPSTLFLH